VLINPSGASGWEAPACSKRRGTAKKKRYNRGTVLTLGPGQRLGPYESSALGAGWDGRSVAGSDTRLTARSPSRLKQQFSQRFQRKSPRDSELTIPISATFDVGPRLPGNGIRPRGRCAERPDADAEGRRTQVQILAALDAAHPKHHAIATFKSRQHPAHQQGIKLLDFGLAIKRKSDRSHATKPTPRKNKPSPPGTDLAPYNTCRRISCKRQPTDMRSDLFRLRLRVLRDADRQRAFT